MKKMTLVEFKQRAKEIHSELYCYDKVDYIDSQTKICIICPIHGEFYQIPNAHLRGDKCRKCSYVDRGMDRRMSQDNFIEKCRKKHSNKYNYDKTVYVNSRSKITVTCPIHGDFFKKASNHLSGQGCPKCVDAYGNHGWNKQQWKSSATKSKHFDSFKVYVVRLFDENESFFKIGRTFRTIESRMKAVPYEYEIVKIFQGESDDMFDLEVGLKRKNKQNMFKPQKQFGGSSECFISVDELSIGYQE